MKPIAPDEKGDLIRFSTHIESFRIARKGNIWYNIIIKARHVTRQQQKKVQDNKRNGWGGGRTAENSQAEAEHGHVAEVENCLEEARHLRLHVEVVN